MVVRLNAKKREVNSLIREVDKVIAPLLETVNVDDLSKHNAGYRCYKTDKFKYFVESEKNRFIKVIDVISNDRQHGTVCDLGCFIPYLPVALSVLGYKVKIVDKYDFYGRFFKDSILKLAEDNNITLFDIDILCDSFESLGRNDIVLLMAVVEHLNGTPRFLFEKIPHILSDTGFFLFETPNIAEFTKRIKMLLGHSPLPDYKDYFHSAYPFTGHNREMTVSEVVYLFEQTGFKIERLECYDYAGSSGLSAWGRALRIIKNILPLRNKGQSILVKGKVRR